MDTIKLWHSGQVRCLEISVGAAQWWQVVQIHMLFVGWVMGFPEEMHAGKRALHSGQEGELKGSAFHEYHHYNPAS